MKTVLKAMIAIAGCLVFTAKVNKAVAQCTPPGSISVTQPTSCSTPDGSITIGSPGPAGYQFSKDDGLTFQVSNVFPNLAPGTYTLRSKEIATGCISTSVTQVLVNPAAAITSSTTGNTGCTTQNGSITFTAPLAGYTYSIDGGTTFQPGATFNNLAAGTYSLAAKNTTSGCISSAFAIVANSPVAPTTPVANPTNPSACNVSDGQITVTSPAPVANFSFSKDGGITFQPGNVFTGLAAGSYTIVARNNATGCISPSLTVPLSGPAVTAPGGVASANTSCTGSYNGSITINSPAPVANFTFSIDGGVTFQASNIFNGLAPGTYRIMAKSNSTTCVSAESSIAVGNSTPTPAAPTTNNANPTSCQTPDGSITITNPASGVTYSIDGGATFQVSNVFSNLPGGTYSVVTKNNTTGCVSLTRTVNLVNPAVVTPTAAGNNNLSCNGSGSGSITVSAPVGASFEYSNNNGAFQSSPVFTGLVGGTYSIIARNTTTGCISLPRVVTLVNSPQTISVSVTATSPTICSPANGQITVTSPAAAGHTFSIDGGVTFQASNLFTGLGGGTYTVIAKNNTTGCTGNSVPVSLTTPTVAGINGTAAANTSCATPNGSITFTGPVPTANFSFSIDGGVTFQPTTLFSNLPAGNYPIQAISNSTGCRTAVGGLTINNTIVTPVTPTATKTDVTSCTPANGSITITGPAGILAGHTYSIDNGITFQPGLTFNGLSAGTYRVVARNSTTNCVSNDLVVTINLPVVAAPTVTTTANSNCSGTPNGTITVTAPAAGVEYSIDGGINFQPGSLFNNLAPGTYSVVTRNLVTTCLSPATSATIADNSVLSAPVFTTANPTSCIVSNGSITITSPVGASFEYSINNGASYQSSVNFTGLSGGIYNLIVRNTGSTCISTPVSITLTDPVVAAPVSTVTANSVCSGSPNGAISFTGPAPLANFSFSISNGASFQLSPNFTGLRDSVYLTRVKDNTTGCVSAAVSKTVLLNTVAVPAPTRTVTNNTSCITPNGSITVTGPAPLTNYTFSIDGGVNFQASNLFSGLTAGTYNLVLKSVTTGCLSPVAPVTITNPSVPVPTFNTTNNTNCSVPNGSITVTTPGAGTGYQYSIDNGSSFQLSNIFTGLNAGSYQLVIRAIAGGCRSVAAAVTINSGAAPATPTAQLVHPTSCSGPNGRITFTAPLPLSDYTFSIDNGVTFSASPSFSSLAAGTYNLVVKSIATGCVSAANPVTLTIPSVTVPAAAGTDPVNCTTNSGSIVFSVVAPAPLSNYEFSIDGGVTFQSSPVFNNLAAGQYSPVSRFVSTGCTYPTGTITLSVPATSVPILTVTDNTNCQGVSNGSITVTSPLGAQYEYSIDNGSTWQPGVIFSNINPGVYAIIARNNLNGCISPGAFVAVANNITNPVPVGTSTPSLSCNAPSGTISFIAPVPLSSYSFSIDRGNTFQPTSFFSGLAPGVYGLVVKNNSTGCISRTAVDITIASAFVFPVITYSSVAPTSCIAPNGTIEFSVPEPNPYSDFEFSINNGTTYQASPKFNNLAPGTYMLRFRSTINGCTGTPAVASLTFAQPAVASPLTTITGASYCTPNNGSIAFTGPLPLADYQFSINGGVTYSNNSFFAGLAPGTYNTVVKLKSSGCTSAVLPAVILPLSPVPTPEFTQVNPTLCGNADGNITVVNPIVPLNLYQYSIDNGVTFQASNIFSGLSAGAYNVVVRNSITGCVSNAAGAILGCTTTPEVTKAVYKNGGTTPATSAALNDVLNYVIQIKGNAPASPPTLTDVMSDNQQYIANSAIADSWTLNGGTAAWFGPTGTGTATALYGGPLSSTVNGGFIPLYGFNSYSAINIVTGSSATNVTFNGAGDGMQPIYWKDNNCQEKVMVKNHADHSSPKCWNLTINVSCDNEISNLTNSNQNYSYSSLSGWSVTVNNKVYTVDQAGTPLSPQSKAQWNCIDLNPGGSPFYCTGYPKAFPTGILAANIPSADIVNNTDAYDPVNDKVYVWVDSGLYRVVYSLKLSTGEISESKAFEKPQIGSPGTYAKTVFLGNNRLLLEGVNNTQCVDLSTWPVMKDCNPSNIPGVFTLYGAENSENLSAPLLDASGNLTGFCLSSWSSTGGIPNYTQCYSLTGAAMAKPAGYVPTYGFASSYKVFGTKVITMGGTPADAFNGMNYFCFDFATNTSCGSSLGVGSDGYGLEWRVPGKCFLIFGDRGVLTQYGLEPTGIVQNSELCKQNACSAFTETVPDPAIRFCGPQVSNIRYKQLTISHLPSVHSGTVVTIRCGGSVVGTFNIPANASVFTRDISAIVDYAVCPRPEITVEFSTLPAGTLTNVLTEVTYDNNGRFPEICYNAKVLICDGSDLTNTVSIAGGGTTTVLDNTTVSSGCIPLPVKLADFTANTRDCSVKLKWTTAEEVNFDRFELERSNDGGNSFVRVNTTTAIGTGSIYSFTDNTATPGRNLYRLKMIDKDGKFSYSKIVLVSLSCDGSQTIILYPNPVKDRATISGLKKGDKIELYGANGQLLISKLAVNEQEQLDLSRFANGLYAVIVSNKESKLTTIKIVKN